MSNYLMGQSSLFATPLSRNEIGDLGSLFSCWENMVRLVVGRTLSSVSR